MIKALKKRIIFVALICLIALFVSAGILMIGNVNAVARADAIGAYVVTEISSDVPKDLKELQNASDAQLSTWAETLDKFDGKTYGYVT